MTDKDGNGFWYVQQLIRYFYLTSRTALVFHLQRRRIRHHLFCMEETNYHRSATAPMADSDQDHPQPDKLAENGSDEEKATRVQSTANTDIDHGTVIPSTKKTYLEKLKVIRRKDLRSKVPLANMVMRTFLYFSFPVVVFSGFMYGAVVCYFNVLNATASLILSGDPYNFSSSIVGLSYVSTLIGVCLG